MARRSRNGLAKPLAGQFAKAGIEAAEVLKEFRVDAAKAGEYQSGRGHWR